MITLMRCAVDAVAQADSGSIGCHPTKAPARELRELREVVASEQLERLLAGKGNAFLGISRNQAERAGNDIEKAVHVCCLGHMFRTTLSFSGTNKLSTCILRAAVREAQYVPLKEPME